MSDAFKVCPICEGRNHPNAALCATCGATIVDIPLKSRPAQPESLRERYAFQLGEADLAEEVLRPQGRALSLILGILVLLLMTAFAAIALLPALTGGSDTEARPSVTPLPTRIAGPTVTAGAPSATWTASAIPIPTATAMPTESPCRQRVNPGDSLIAIVARCGYRDLAILPTVMALNGISDETRLQVGKDIIVPKPGSAAPLASTEPPAAEQESAAADAGNQELLRLAFDPFAPTLTPTLLPGLMWHIVQPDETVGVLALLYEMDLKALSDLNPEVDFPLCDFSQRFGGPECTVILSRGQRLRVPAPTPSVTPIPTASGSETPTPTATATFNAPLAQRPLDEAFFAPQEQVTLRWVGTGKLAADETYRVLLSNTDTGAEFSAETRELFFIIPAGWQAQAAGSHRYRWQIQVVQADSGALRHESAPRSFIWQGKGASQ